MYSIVILKANVKFKEIYQHFDETNVNGPVVGKLEEVFELL